MAKDNDIDYDQIAQALTDFGALWKNSGSNQEKFLLLLSVFLGAMAQPEVHNVSIGAQY